MTDTLEDRWKTLRQVERWIAFKIMASHELDGNFLHWVEAYLEADWPKRDAFAARFKKEMELAMVEDIDHSALIKLEGIKG